MRAVAVLIALAVISCTTATTVTSCTYYTTCPDCACSTTGYSIGNSCIQGCAWVPELAECMTPAAAAAAGYNSTKITQLWKVSTKNSPYDDDDDSDAYYNKLLELGLVNCPTPVDPAAIATICIMVFLTVSFVGCMAWGVVKQRAGRMMLMPKLHRAVTEAAPPSEQIIWKGEMRGAPIPRVKLKGTIIATSVGVALLLIPSVVWSILGLPLTIEEGWGFEFFYPIYFVGGFGLLWALGSVAAGSSSAASMPNTAVFALTGTHFLAASPCPSGVLVVSHALTQVSQVVQQRAGGVTFTTAESGVKLGHTILSQRAKSLSGVIDPTSTNTKFLIEAEGEHELFTILQTMQTQGASAAAERIAMQRRAEQWPQAAPTGDSEAAMLKGVTVSMG